MSLLDTIIGSKRPPEQKTLAVTSPLLSPLSPAPIAEVTEVIELAETFHAPTCLSALARIRIPAARLNP